MLINNLNPVAFEIFFIKIHWYSLAYIFGIICGWIYIKKILIKNNIHKIYIDDLITYLIIGIIIGGRLGYVLIYNPKILLKNFRNNYDMARRDVFSRRFNGNYNSDCYFL